MRIHPAMIVAMGMTLLAVVVIIVGLEGRDARGGRRDRRLGAGRLDQPVIQPSNFRPLTTTSFAPAIAFASAGVGE